MNKTNNRTGLRGMPTNAATPIPHGMLAGLLAATLTVSGCGGAADAQPDMSAAQPGDLAASLSDVTPRSVAGLRIELVDADESDGKISDPIEGESDASGPSANVEGKAVNCAHSWRVTVYDVDSIDARNYKTLWGEFTSSGALQNMTFNASHPFADHEEMYIRPYHSSYRWLGTAPLTNWSTKLYSTGSGRATFDIKWNHSSASSSDCRTVKTLISQINNGGDPSSLTSNRWVAKGVGYLSGAIVSVAATSRIAQTAPRSIAGWGAPIGGCIGGMAQLIMQTALEDSWQEHGWWTLADISYNCATGAGLAAISKFSAPAADTATTFVASAQASADIGAVIEQVRNQVPMVNNAFRVLSFDTEGQIQRYATQVSNAMNQAYSVLARRYGVGQGGGGQP